MATRSGTVSTEASNAESAKATEAPTPTAAGHPGRRMDAKRNQTAPSEPRVEPRTLIDAENHDRVDGHDPLTATATAASSGMGRASPRRRPTATVSAKHAAKPPIIRKAATSHDAVPAKDTASKATTKPGMT
jgi:hypothetical protein